MLVVNCPFLNFKSPLFLINIIKYNYELTFYNKVSSRGHRQFD